MNELKSLIQSLNDQEVDGFFAFAKARNKREDVYNIQLFKLLRSGITQDLDLKIYGKVSKNALYALKSRLQSSILEFIALQGFENDQKIEMAALKLLLSSRILLEKEFWSLGLKTLIKAELLAYEQDLYTILHEIYSTYLQYVHHFPKVQWVDVSAKFIANQQQQQQTDRIALLFSEHKNTDHPLGVSFYKDQIKQLDIKITDKLSYKNLYELLEVFTDAATLEGNYNLIENEINRIRRALEKKGAAKRHSSYYLEITFLLALSYFRTSQFKKATQYLAQLEEFDKLPSSRRQHIIVLQSLCFNYMGAAKTALEHLLQIKNMQLDTQCVAAMFYLQQEKPQNALRQLNKLKHRDSYYEKYYSKPLVVKKNLLLLLIYIELDNVNLIESQLVSLKKKLTSIRELKESRIAQFIKLINAYCDNPRVVETNSFLLKMDQLTVNSLPEDVFAISFYAWLKSKVTKRPLYELTMELISKANIDLHLG